MAWTWLLGGGIAAAAFATLGVALHRRQLLWTWWAVPGVLWLNTAADVLERIDLQQPAFGLRLVGYLAGLAFAADLVRRRGRPTAELVLDACWVAALALVPVWLLGVAPFVGASASAGQIAARALITVLHLAGIALAVLLLADLRRPEPTQLIAIGFVIGVAIDLSASLTAAPLDTDAPVIALVLVARGAAATAVLLPKIVDAATPRPPVSGLSRARILLLGAAVPLAAVPAIVARPPLPPRSTWLAPMAVVPFAVAAVYVARLILADRANQRARQVLADRAEIDPLTGLPNRVGLDRVLTANLAEGGSTAVVFCDLDGFKDVNDALGHEAGDELLRAAAVRLQSALAETGTLARFAGDEFVAIVPGVDDDLDAERLALDLISSLREPLRAGGIEIAASASAGAVVVPPRTDAADALRDADAAMYAAKARGRARVSRYDPALTRNARRRLGLSTDLRGVADRGELRCAVMPITQVSDGRLRRVEALARWAHPRSGLVEPASFLPLASVTGDFVAIGQWMRNAALHWLAQERAAGRAGPDLIVAVNVSRAEIVHPGFAGEVTASLARTGLRGSDLVLEVVETDTLRDLAAVAVLGPLREAGVRVELDDFGAGESSLEVVANLPPHMLTGLKLDRQFIQRAVDQPPWAYVAQAVVDVGHRLNLDVTLEGVETEAEWELVRAMARPPTLAQGFHLGRPVLDGRADQLVRLGQQGASSADAASDVTADRGPGG